MCYSYTYAVLMFVSIYILGRSTYRRTNCR